MEQPLNHNVQPYHDMLLPGRLWETTASHISPAEYEQVRLRMAQAVLFEKHRETLDQLEAYDQETLAEKRAAVEAHEQQFVEAVSRGVLTAMEQNPNATEYTLLFDLDQTLLDRAQIAAGHRPPVIRPSAVPLLETLNAVDPRINIGILTEMPQAYLDQEIRAPKELAAIMPYVNPEVVIGTHDITAADKDTFSSQYLPTDYRGTVGVRRKLYVCEQLLHESSNRSVMLVDNNARGLALVTADKQFRVVVAADFRIYD